MEPVPEILVVGSVAYDSIETPFGKAEETLGGSATHFSAAASFFAPVRLVAVVGEDFDPSRLDFLRKRGVDLAGLEVVEGGRTFRWAGRYHYDLNTRDTLGTWLNVFEHFDPKLDEAARKAKYVFLANIHPSLQLKVLEQVEAPELVLMDSMNLWIENTLDDLKKVLSRVDMLIVNDEEARELANEPNLVKAAQKIRAMGPDRLIIKKGEHGALLFEDDTIFVAPAYPLENVYDPTGAGDTFAGGLMGSWLASGGPAAGPGALRRAVIHGSALASFCVEKFGVDRLAELTREEAEARYREFRGLTEFHDL